MKKSRRIVAVVMIFIILCTSTVCYGDIEASFGTTHWNDMDASWEDISAYKTLSEDILSAIEDAALPADEICKMFDELDKACNRYCTAYMINEIKYCMDTTAKAQFELYEEINALYSEAVAIYYQTGVALLDSDYADKVFADYTEFEKEDIRLQANTMTDEYVAYQTRLYELIREYYDSYYMDVSIDGVSMSLDEVKEKYGEDRYEEEFSRIVAPIYLEVVELNNSYAVSCGYPSFNEYAYEVLYLRDYTLADAQVLFDGVKKYIAPLVLGLECEEILETVEDFRYADYEDEMRTYAHSVSPSMGAAFDALIEYGLCHVTDSPNSMDAGITFDLPSYNEAAIYNRLYNNYLDLFYMAHEFGHFYDFYLNGNFESLFPDISEIPSTSAELLFSVYAENIFDSETYCLIKTDYLNSKLEIFVRGLEYAEFENRVYSSGFTTPEELNRCYSEICASYGDVENAEKGYHWSQIHHLFDFPLYYIGYVTSLIPSLEILTTAVNDYKAGAAVYDSMLRTVGEYNGTEDGKTGYTNFLEAMGIPSPFQEEGIKALAESIKKLR